jgi:putative transposase
MTATLATTALEMAIYRRYPLEELLHHSDHGVQYASKEYQELLKKHGMVCSMSRKGNCWDNAPMESFFSTLKAGMYCRKNLSD